jgi:hypothetical protein
LLGRSEAQSCGASNKKPLHFLKCNGCYVFILLPFVYRLPLVADAGGGV